MSQLHSLIASSLSLLAMISAHAGPMETLSEFELSERVEDDPLALEDDDLSFEEEALPADDLEEIDQEILVLEEELKKDADALQPASSELLAVPSPVAEPSQEPSPLQPPAISEPIATLPALQETIAPEPSSQEIPQVEILADTASALSPQAIFEPPATLEIDPVSERAAAAPVEIDIQQAFAGAPIIYSILLTLSAIAFCLWLYHLLSLKKQGEISEAFLKNLKNRLNSNHFDDALSLCLHHENLFSKMVASGINTRKHGLPTILESMKEEGKRASVHFWQRIGLLNDIAIIAPMLGLLGTVLGMFYAFYDLNRSIESISSLFDGLGVSVGTTVAGLIVAILALILHSVAKYRLVKVLARIENEAQSLGTLIDNSKN